MSKPEERARTLIDAQLEAGWVVQDRADPDARSRRVFSFHRPETLLGWLKDGSSLRARLQTPPPPAEIAAEIVDSLELALEKFRSVAAKLEA